MFFIQLFARRRRDRNSRNSCRKYIKDAVIRNNFIKYFILIRNICDKGRRAILHESILDGMPIDNSDQEKPTRPSNAMFSQLPLANFSSACILPMKPSK